MLRPMVATAAVTAAVVLLAGCGGNDKKTDAKSGDGAESTSSTPSAPAVASFDPPKGLSTVSAFGVPDTPTDDANSIAAGMVGQTSLLSSKAGLVGRNVAAQSDPWTVPSTTAETTTTSDHTTPMPVQLDGKDVIAVAYVQNDKGNGTQKAKGQVLFQWLDAADGKKVAEVTADLTSVLGPGGGGDNVVSQAFDPATGQVAVGVSPGSEESAKKTVGALTVYADPKTQKATVIPSVAPAGVLNGTVVGAKGSNQENAHDGTIVILDGASGKISKQIPTKQNYLSPSGSGTKRAYLSSSSYVPNENSLKTVYNSVLYSVDIATGSIVQMKPQLGTADAYEFTCLGDQASAVVCTTGDNGQQEEIIGIDDNSGKKAWGYTNASANRVVPSASAVFHGVVYGKTDSQLVLLNAANGQDIPTSTPTPTGTPSDGTTPSSTPTPDDNATPTQDNGTKDPGSAFGSDLSLYDTKLGIPSPTAVTKYGGAYLQEALGDDLDNEKILIVMKPTA